MYFNVIGWGQQIKFSIENLFDMSNMLLVISKSIKDGFLLGVEDITCKNNNIYPYLKFVLISLQLNSNRSNV